MDIENCAPCLYLFSGVPPLRRIQFSTVNHLKKIIPFYMDNHTFLLVTIDNHIQDENLNQLLSNLDLNLDFCFVE